MAYRIPDEILETLTCDICYKYLSFQPIQVFPNGKTVCGRCIKTHWNNGVNSLYNAIGEKTYFKCVNRFDGCRELLTYSQVPEHEKKCFNKVFKCPICTDNTDIPTYLIIKHFQDNHSKSILNQRLIHCNLDSEMNEVYLHNKENNLFFLYLLKRRSDEIVKVKMSYLGDSTSLYHQFIVTSGNKDFRLCSLIKPCKEYGIYDEEYFNINLMGNINHNNIILITFELIISPVLEIDASSKTICSYIDDLGFIPLIKPRSLRKLHLDEEFKQKHPDISLSKCGYGLMKSNELYFPHCANCQEICILPFNWYNMYVNTKSRHCLCYYCFRIMEQKTTITESDYVTSCVSLNILDDIKYFCKCNCNKTFTVTECIEHEIDNFSTVPLRCFKCYNNFYTLFHLKNHMENMHNINPNAYNNTLSVTFCNLNESINEYLYAGDQLVWIECDSNISKDNVDITVHFNKNIRQSAAISVFDKASGKYLMGFENFASIKKADYVFKVFLIKSSN